MNQIIKNFEDELIALINKTQLPPSLLFYILESKTNEVKLLFYKDIYKEKEEAGNQEDLNPLVEIEYGENE